MKNIWWIVGGVCCAGLVLVIIGLVVFGVYFGFSVQKMPQISNIFELGTPKDLGVKYTEADLKMGRETTKVELNDLVSTNGKTLEFEGVRDISGTYSSETITAMVNGARYVNYPLSNTQVRINPDGTIETSGNLDINKLVNWVADINADATLTDQAQNYMGAISANPSFYLKGNMSVKNNQVDLNIANAQISFFNATPEQIGQYTTPIELFVSGVLNKVPNMNIKSADFSTGKLILDGTYPAIEKSTK